MANATVFYRESPKAIGHNLLKVFDSHEPREKDHSVILDVLVGESLLWRRS